MSNLPSQLDNKIEAVIMQGDLSKLTSDERLSYINNVCNSLGLNPLTRPFEYLTFQGRLILYARKDCTEQLRKLHGVGITDLDVNIVDGLCIARAKAKDKDGKEDCATGVVNVENLKGEAKANAMMKSETKAKRRVTLSICGLGILDESELDGMSGATILEETKELEPPKPKAALSEKDEQMSAIAELCAKFRKIGVSESMICAKYKKQSVAEINSNEYAELNDIGFQIKNKKLPIETFFRAVP